MALGKAFDTLNHNILLVHNWINGTALEWFTCYLKGRSRYIEMNWVPSDILSLSIRVPQG